MNKYFYTLFLLIIVSLPITSFADEAIHSGLGYAGNNTGCDTSCDMIGSPFTPSVSGTISSIKFAVKLNNSPTDDAIITIRDSSGSHYDTASDLAHVIKTYTDITGTLTEYTETLSSPVNVTAGTTYWVTFGRSGASSATDYYRYGLLAGSGTLWENVGASFTDDSPNEMYFELTVVELASGTTTATTTSAYTGAGLQEWLFVACVIIFFISLIGWGYIFKL